MGTAELCAKLGRTTVWAASQRHGVVPSALPPTDGGGLYEVVDGATGDDSSVRPNQLLAVSLPHGPVTDPSVVDVCRGSLLTSVGLRSLAAGTTGHQVRTAAAPPSVTAPSTRHRVAPWLIGPFVDAAQLAGRRRHSRAPWPRASGGLGSVAETADGDPPHATTGCPFQAGPSLRCSGRAGCWQRSADLFVELPAHGRVRLWSGRRQVAGEEKRARCQS